MNYFTLPKSFCTIVFFFISLTYTLPGQAQNYVSNVAKFDSKDGLSSNQLAWVFQDSRGLLWIGASNGINKYTGSNFQLVREFDFASNSTHKVLEDDEHNLWIETGNANSSFLLFNTITYNFDEKLKANEKYIPGPNEVRKNTMEINWKVGHDNVIISNQDSEIIFDLKLEYPALHSLQINDKVFCQEYCWLATNQGLLKIGIKQSYFQRHLYSSQNNLQLSNTPESNIYFYRGIYARNISADNDGKVYVTTRGKGVIELDQNETRVKSPNGYFWGSYFDGSRYLWISRFRDILRYDLKTNNEKIFKFPGKGDKAWAFHTDVSGKIWIGCNREIYTVEKYGDRLIPFDHGFDEANIIPMKQKYFFFGDSEGNMWMGATAGLFRMDFQKGITDHYWPGGEGKHHLPILELRHIHEDADAIFWIATTKGLLRWNRKTNEYRKFGLADGFSSERIYAVFEDDFGYLWMSSENGLMQFSKETFQVKAYQTADGIAHNIFNRVSHYQASDGTIYFGGYNGVTSFHPRDFQHAFKESRNVPVILTQANALKDKDPEPYSKLEDFHFQELITINPGDRFLDMKFELLNYDPGVAGNFEYKVDLNNETDAGEWNAIAGDHLQLAALPYGKHTLKVRGFTAYAQNSHHPLEIPILVARPFFLKAWFYFALVLLSAGGLIYYQRRKSTKYLERQTQLENIVKKRTQKIQTQAEELRELDKTKSRFLANISHEFRTPLTLILNILNKEEVQSMNAEEISNGKLFGKTELDILQRNSGKLKLLIEQLLDLSKLEAGKMELQIEKGEFHFYLKGIVQTFQALAEQSNIDLIFSSNAQSAALFFDRDKMDKIFYNLLSNAIKFSPNGGNIRVDLQKNENELLVSVKDEGIGIPANELQNIFERFYQINQIDQYGFEGSGLGLALVKDFVELHHGRIEVISKPGEGTLFILHFPLDVPFTKEIKTPQVANFNKSISHNPIAHFEEVEIPAIEKTEKDLPILLIIEDNADLRFYHHKFLSNKYRILFAEDGTIGLEMAKDNIPDLIICDVMMPGANGFAVCTALKKDELCNHIPIVLLTARATHSDRIAGIQAGADDFMTKPFDQKELNLRIEKLLAQRELLKAKYSHQNPSIELKAPEYHDPFVKKLIIIIDDNIQDITFGIKELSRSVALSRSQLFRKVKATTGESPTDFLKKHRLKKAHQLLMEDAGNVSEVSYQVGFRTPNYFHKCFKEEFGFTPGEIMRST